MRSWLQITSGRGPEECCWVVARLTNYLLQLAAREKIEAEIIDALPGNSPSTFRSVLIAVEREHGLGKFLADWQGTVQWIGQSMLRSGHRRKNWFVSVTAIEAVEQSELDMTRIRIETMRASGAGGQHVNKTESAIRVTDLITGLSAVSQEERSQYLNKKLALARLQQRIDEMKKQTQNRIEQQRWQQHNALERGNAVHVFTGNDFRIKK